MKNTYTYSARSIDHPERVITFTLHDRWLSVEPGAPVEFVEQVVEVAKGKEGQDEEMRPTGPWLKPLAVSLAERSTRPFRIVDINADMAEDRLYVQGWIRTGGLRLLPITLIKERVDNPTAAGAFVKKIDERKAESQSSLQILDYWATWVVAGTLLLGLFQLWRQRDTQPA